MWVVGANIKIYMVKKRLFRVVNTYSNFYKKICLRINIRMTEQLFSMIINYYSNTLRIYLTYSNGNIEILKGQ